MSGKALTPDIFMDGGGNSRLLIRYRLVENRIKLMGEIGADNVYVTYAGTPTEETFDIRIQPSIYDQVFVRSAFDLAERGADVQLDVLVMQALSKSRTLITRLSGSASPGQTTGRSTAGNSLIEVTGRVFKIYQEESTQSMTETFKRHRMASGKD